MLGILFGLVLGILIALGVAWYVNKAPLPFQNKTGKPAAPATKPAAPVAKPNEPAEPAQEPARQAKAAPAAPEVSPATKPAAPVTLPGRPGEKPAERPRFDFYKMLPSGEEPSAKPERPEKKPEAAPSPPAASPTEPMFLQAGSFQNPDEADNLKAKLALLGLEAGVQATELPGKGTVHRVRIGPFTKPGAMNRARTLLAENGVQAKVVKAK